MVRIKFYQVIIFLAFLVSILQYSSVIINSIIAGKSVYWQLTDDMLKSSGVMRYVKDIYNLFIGLLWVFTLKLRKLPASIKLTIISYFLWLLSLIMIGIIVFLFSNTPLPLLIPGFRWLLLLHTGFGLFILTLELIYLSNQTDALLFPLIFLLLIINLSVTYYQYVSAGFPPFARFRLPGLYGNAGTLGTAAVGFAIVGLSYNISKKILLIYLIICWLLAGFSGSRFSLFAISICIIAILLFIGYESLSFRGFMGYLVVFALLLLASSSYLYDFIVKLAGRGDLLMAQKTGRLQLILFSIKKLFDAPLIVTLFGGGLGSGTNSLSILHKLIKIKRGTVYFYWICDNTFLPILLQFGLVGAFIFWAGFILWLKKIFNYLNATDSLKFLIICVIFLLECFTGNFFEQYHLLYCYAFSLAILVGRYIERGAFATSADTSLLPA